MESLAGQIVSHYAFLEKLGAGGMGEIYKARDSRLNRIVAVKVLPKKMSDSTEFVDRFYKEGRAAARLSHNNIVQAIDVGSNADGLHYFVKHLKALSGKQILIVGGGDSAAEEALFLAAPQTDTDGAIHLQVQGFQNAHHFDHHRAAGAVVGLARSGMPGIEVRPDHDHLVRLLAAGDFSNDVGGVHIRVRSPHLQ